MASSRHWARNFSVTPEDVDLLLNLLIETETPMTTRDLAQALVRARLESETKALREQYSDARLYDPAQSYQVGQKVIFPARNFAIAVVDAVRAGDNPDYGDFRVMNVRFDDDDAPHEFAMELSIPHKLNIEPGSAADALPSAHDFTFEEVFEENGAQIIAALEKHLKANPSLAYVTRHWFPRDLLLEVDEGHLHLAEAVLDLAGGGPLHTREIIEQIGGLGGAPIELQVFSMNLALDSDPRFDEVGPAGEVLWYLRRMEPKELHETPPQLRYQPLEYDRNLLTADMRELERELDDELSDLPDPADRGEQGTVLLTYPHRRVGTLPLSRRVRGFFPTAQRAPRIHVTLVDGQDGEEFTGWVVHSERYVYGVANFYRKHKVPIGCLVTVRPHQQPGKVIIDINSYRPRTEYVPIISARNEAVAFENVRRSIGADYDDLMILGVDDLAEVEGLAELFHRQRKPLAALLKQIIPALGRLTPQGTAHAKTIYSAVNVLRRCPPGPILAMLNANPDFENVGGHYWKLSE